MVVAGVSGSGVTSGLAAAGCVIGGGAAAGPLVLALGPAAVSIAAIAKEEPRQRLAAARDRADNAEIRTRLYRFYSWCADAKIPELTRLATTIETWWPAILAFLHTGLTNARTEGYNRLVKQVKRVACGFRNTENSRRRIRFHCTRAQRASIRFTTAQLPG